MGKITISDKVDDNGKTLSINVNEPNEDEGHRKRRIEKCLQSPSKSSDEERNGKPEVKRSSPYKEKEVSSSILYTQARKIQSNKHQKNHDAGQLEDFRQDLHYVLTTLLDEKSNINLKNLSLIQLLKKCVSSQFRSFLRTHKSMSRLLQILLENAPKSQLFSFVSAVFLYLLLARDHKNLILNPEICQILLQLIREHLVAEPLKLENDQIRKQYDSVWSIINEWLNVCKQKTSKDVQFDFTPENLASNPSFIALETLAYISIREYNNNLFKSELLNSGCLANVVATLDRAVSILVVNKSSFKNETEGHFYLNLLEAERSYRILENALTFTKKNQSFVIQHRNGAIMFSSARLLKFILEIASTQNLTGNDDKNVKQQDQRNKICKKSTDIVGLLCRVLMNLTHENEPAALKLGQIADFLNNCLTVLSSYSPRNVTKEKFFDLCAMMCGLLVNLLERCSSNRRRFLSLNVIYYESENQTSTELGAIEVLVKLFWKHDSTAKSIDEELDNELMFEEPLEVEAGTGENSSQSQCDTKKVEEMSEDQVFAAVKAAMNKASDHMEGSLIASYIALLLGCLVDNDEAVVEKIRQFMPNGNLKAITEQLGRFLDFMKVTGIKASAIKSIERILNSMEIACSD